MIEDEKPTVKMILDSVVYVVKQYLSKTPDTIVSINENNDKWVVTVEVVERKSVPDTQDVMGRYEINLDKRGELLGWKQIMIRRRSDSLVEA